MCWGFSLVGRGSGGDGSVFAPLTLVSLVFVQSLACLFGVSV